MRLKESDLNMLVGLEVSEAVENLEKQGMKVTVREFFTDKQPKWDCLLVIRVRQTDESEVELVVGNFLLSPVQTYKN